jgi:hypothetical protein
MIGDIPLEQRLSALPDRHVKRSRAKFLLTWMILTFEKRGKDCKGKRGRFETMVEKMA